MKKILFFVFIISALSLAGCANKTPSDDLSVGSNQSEINVSGSQTKACQPGPVDIEGYGDKGNRLANCFVQYPGEPSRQDKSYYIVEDVCGQFTKEFIANLLEPEITKIVLPQISSLYNCSYYFNDKDYLMLSLNYLSVENQKKGHEILGRTIKTDDRIKMEHFIVWQEDGLINEIYLVLNPNKYISLNRAGKTLANDQFLNFAIRLSEQIKGYK